MKKFYAGIGSRETPQEILEKMKQHALFLQKCNYILRSGGADGADKAFESGAGSLKEIYLPWKNFNGSISNLIQIPKQAYESVYKYHPNPYALSQGALKLMARDYCQVFGYDEEPINFCLCWTKNGKASGGTGQAIRICEANGIPVYNYYNQEEEIEKILKICYNEV